MTEVSKIPEIKLKNAKVQKIIKKSPDPRYPKILQILQEKFPEAFPTSQVRVLKLGIHKDIKENTEINSKDIFIFMRIYCRSFKYRQAHIEGASRYDLNGITTQTVTAEQAAKKAEFAKPQVANVVDSQKMAGRKIVK